VEAQLTTRLDNLTIRQQEVVDAPVDARLLITAGPGTGKTYVLIRRLARLVTEEGLSAAQEVLALSFSRNAVKNIRDRVMSMSPAVRYIRVSTFDSFASRLLRSEDPEGPWSSKGYDERIQIATDLLRGGRDLDDLTDIKQILIDEVQDLVGPRRAFVEALLAHSATAGFSIFGDPAQGIYNFQLPPGPERDAGSALFYQWLRDTYKGGLREVELDHNFRAQTEGARVALWAGQELARVEPDCQAIWDRFSAAIGRLPTLGEVDTAARSLGRNPKTTALLCRDNGQALVASRTLSQKAIAHTLQRAAADRAVAAWVARSLWGITTPTVSRTSYEARVQDLSLAIDPDTAWRALKRSERKPGDQQLDLRSLNRAIVSGDVGDELLHQPDTGLVVSSIHRAKGLEFHTVGLVQPQDRFDDLTRCEETRLLYVALTRPSHQLMHVAGPDTKGMSSKKNPEDRWVRRRSFGNAAYMTLNFEVRGSDIDPSVPFMQANGLPPLSAAQMLSMCEAVRPGEPVELWLDEVSQGAPPRYVLMHKVGALGVTGARFANCLQGAIAISRTHGVPRKIEDLWIEFVDTVAGDPAVSRVAGIGESGLWLRVRAFGLGHLVWK